MKYIFWCLNIKFSVHQSATRNTSSYHLSSSQFWIPMRLIETPCSFLSHYRLFYTGRHFIWMSYIFPLWFETLPQQFANDSSLGLVKSFCNHGNSGGLSHCKRISTQNKVFETRETDCALSLRKMVSSRGWILFWHLILSKSRWKSVDL